MSHRLLTTSDYRDWDQTKEHQKQKTLVLGLGSLRSCVFLHGKDVCIDKTDETDAAVLAGETSVVEKDDGRKVPVIRVGVA